MANRAARVPRAGLAPFGYVDVARRGTGRVLDAVGVGPQPTPSQLLPCAVGVQLRTYPDAVRTGAPVLLVPAPIKRSYIWDLAPDISVVARCLELGLRVFLAEWTDPGSDGRELGLEEYADHLLAACVRTIVAETGHRQVLLVGHSLGGTLAAIFAARHPESVAGIALLESPLSFGPRAGAFAPLVAVAPRASWPRSRRGVPGSFLDVAAAAAAPVSFQLERYADLVRSLGSGAALKTHMRVERWTLDELALPGRLFEEVVERLYRRDELMAGTLSVAGRRVGPATLVVPMLNVVAPLSRVIPPASILPFHNAAASPRKELIYYAGDTGVALQHVGVLVGRNAHARLWPALLRWLDQTTAAAAGSERAQG